MGQGLVNRHRHQGRDEAAVLEKTVTVRGLVPGTHHHLKWECQTRQKPASMGDADPRGTPALHTSCWMMYYSMAYPRLSMIPHCRRISVLSRKISSARAGSHHPRVPAAFPADRISHFCIWFAQLDRTQLLSKSTLCGFQRRSGRSTLPRTELGLCTEEQESFKHLINPSMCTSFPSFFMESVLQGKLRHERTGAVPV